MWYYKIRLKELLYLTNKKGRRKMFDGRIEPLPDLDDRKMYNIWQELQRLIANPNYIVEQKWRGYTLVFSIAPRAPIYHIGGLNRAMLGLFKELPTWKKEFWEAYGGIVYFGCLGFCSQGRFYDVVKQVTFKKGALFDIDELWYRIDFYPDALHLRRGTEEGISAVSSEKLRPSRRIAPLVLNATKEKLEDVGRTVRHAGENIAGTSNSFFEKQSRKTRNLTERVAVEVSHVRIPL